MLVSVRITPLVTPVSDVHVVIMEMHFRVLIKTVLVVHVRKMVHVFCILMAMLYVRIVRLATLAGGLYFNNL